ncbi:MAG: hypothetical protein AB8U25_04990 [Rickettsiales endosymbiont of Dermacentor nuttalli]
MILCDHAAILSLLKDKSLAEKHKLFKQKVVPTIRHTNYEAKGYNIFKLAQEFNHESLYNFLKQEYENVLRVNLIYLVKLLVR